jgi:hypothetical protein
MANTFELIASSTVGSGGAASISFTSIATSWTDLQVVLSIRGTAANVANAQYLSINGSSGSTNFSGKLLEGDGSTAYSANPTYFIGNSNNANSTANTFASISVYLPNYLSSNFKNYSMEAVTENNATLSYADIYAGLWSQTAAISSISFSQATGNYVQYSSAYLYGIKNS